jgi:hypothetical protein
MFAYLLDTIFLIGQTVSVLALLYGAWLVHGDTLSALFDIPVAPGSPRQPPQKTAVAHRGYMSGRIQ